MSREERQAFISTGVCLAFMILGFVTEKTIGSFYQWIFAIGIASGGWKQTKEGLEELLHEKSLNVDLLMALAAIGACIIGNWFEGIMLTFIFCLSGALEEYATNKSKKELTSLMKMQPTKAMKVLENGATLEVDVKELEIGDLIVVAKGESVAIDGVITQGFTSIDEAAISGESMPVDKTLGAEVFGGTINLDQAFTMRVTKRADDTLFSKIIQLVEEAQASPTKVANYIEKIENIYVRLVLVIVPLMIILPPYLLGWTWTESFSRGMVLLVVASPCAVVASATPATLAAISNGAKEGVLFKGGQYLEMLLDLKAIAFDKTGTLTNGKPIVTDEYFFAEKKEVLPILLAMEKRSTHPLAVSIVEHFKNEQTKWADVEVKEITGFGLEADYNGANYKLGKHAFIPDDKKVHSLINTLSKNGKTVIFLSKEKELIAMLGLLDVEKEGAVKAIDYLRSQGIHTTMMTGDNLGTAKAIAEKVGIDEYYANLLPADKTRLIQEEKDKYLVNAMVGDGINDAPALATATIGVAMGEGSAVAMDVADMVLMKNDLDKLVFSHKLAKKLKRVVTQNIIFSASIILLLILSNFFQVITLPLGVVGHEGSTILVILNGLRLLRSV